MITITLTVLSYENYDNTYFRVSNVRNKTVLQFFCQCIWYPCPHTKKLATPLMSPYIKNCEPPLIASPPPPPPPPSQTAWAGAGVAQK